MKKLMNVLKKSALETLDLTRVMDASLPVYADGDYHDPPFCIKPWCEVDAQGFQVFQVMLGTQTGTHIDAPCHFAPGGATLDALPLDALMGAYFYVDAHQPQLPDDYAGESILFLAAHHTIEITPAFLASLLQLPCRVWVIAAAVQVQDRPPLFFHQALAQAGKYLIEDLDEATARCVKADGRLIALPLNLVGVSGSPCRVVVRQPR